MLKKEMKGMKSDSSSIVTYLLVIGGFLIVTSLICMFAAAEQWNIEQVEEGNVGEFSSHVMDGNNHSHISYYDGSNGDLKYAKWDGNSWDTVVVDSAGDVGKFTSITLDISDNPHISYFDATNENLKYASWNGSAWNIQKVDTTDRVGEFSSIALDSNDYPHIGYYDRDNTNLKYVYWNGSSWHIEVVTNAGGSHTSLALDSNDHPHICYVRTQDLWLSVKSWFMYASWNGSAWNINEIDSGSVDYPFNDKVGIDSSIVIDENDDSHISYIDDVNNQLKYAKRNGSSWSKQVVGGGGSSTSINLNSENYVRISYANWGLYYAKMLPPVPYPPTNLQADHGNGYINLTWNAPANEGGAPVTNYNLYRRTGSGQEEFLLDVGNVTTYNDTDVSNGETYYYRVTCENSYGESPRSNQASATPGERPSAPQNPNARPGESKVVLTWDPPLSNGTTEITNYYVYWGFDQNDVNVDPNIIPVGIDLTYTHYPLANGQGFFYKISCENSVGEGPFSQVVNATPGKAPKAPQNLQASSGDSEVVLKWDAPDSQGDSAITHYNVYRGNVSYGETLYAVLDNVNIYIDLYAINEKTYYYRVAAQNKFGEGAHSPEVNATPSVGKPHVDSDEDGLPDSWEMIKFDGLSQSGEDDFDGDNYSNLREYQEGTDPTSDISFPKEEEGEGGSIWLWVVIIVVILIMAVVLYVFFSPLKKGPQ
jgi:fibronectin type 3 domain-containing protein